MFTLTIMRREERPIVEEEMEKRMELVSLDNFIGVLFWA